MSAQEVRNEIIRENIPLLIKELTGFADDDENLRSYEQMAWSIIRNHRNLSTNSHEVRRRIEGIQEKFAVDNNLEYAEHLGRLCDEVINHPLCKNHYEVDIEWSILDFLISLANNPTGALRRNKDKIDKLLKEHEELFREECDESDTEYWKNILKEDFIPLEHSYSSSSDLSSWSDANIEEVKDSHTDYKPESLSHASRSNPPIHPLPMENIKQPTKVVSSVPYDNTAVEERLLNTVQNSWWEKGAKIVQPTTESTHREANFALEYHNINIASRSQRKRDPPETATEYSLLREILWMFQVPQTCKFFQVNSDRIKIKKNVTLTSTRSSALNSMLENHFLPYIRMMQDFRNFRKLIYAADDYAPPHTLEHYAASLELLLEPIWNELLACERALLTQADREINTLISLHNRLRPTFAKLSDLHSIHQEAVLNIRLLPAHISSTHLLAALIHCNRTATTPIEANLAMSLFLASVRVFLNIADTWWTEGRLDDLHNEFIIKRINESGQSVRVREFCKNKEKAFFIPTIVSKKISENSFFQLLMDHSIEAGCTLNLLYEINRIGELRSACDAIEDKLYKVFIEDVLKYVRILQKQVTETAREAKENNRLEMESVEMCNSVDEVDDLGSDEVVNETDVQATSNDCSEDDQILKKLTTNDDFLLLAFTMNMDVADSEAVACDQCDTQTKSTTKNEETSALEIFEQFQQSNSILPLEEVILNRLSRILKTRIAFANSFVMRLYHEEFDISKHLRNMRKIYLFEASDLMHQFCIKLFKQIESGQDWTNAFLLTTQLDDVICAKYPDMSSLFRFEIYSDYRSRTIRQVHIAVEQISLSYNLSTELTHMIKPRDLETYNRVFRFLLQVKWGLTTMENLQYPRAHRRRPPFEPYDMVDLLMRRLEQIRFWLLFALKNIHFHLMTHGLQAMGEQFDDKIAKCTYLKEMVNVHRAYLTTVCEHCLLTDNFSSIKAGVEQLLNLAYVVRQEWHSCSIHIERKRNPWATVDMDESFDGNVIINSQIKAVEETYVRCHEFFANSLGIEIYINKNTFLLGLCTAFKTNVLY